MTDDDTSRVDLFRPRQFLGPPRVVAPPKAGYVSAVVEFIIPGLAIAKSERNAALRFCDLLGLEIYRAAVDRVSEKKMGTPGTLISIAFYLPEVGSDEMVHNAIENAAVVLVERLMGMLSYFAGTKLTAVHAQWTWVRHDGGFRTVMQPSGRFPGEIKIPFDLPADPFNGRVPTENVFTALFWLRRGLAERDPLDTYAALMVSLQAIAREVVGSTSVERRCPRCGKVTAQDAGVTAMVRELLVGRLEATKEDFSRIWKARNAVVAHGNEPVTADIFLQLTELKFDAATFCYKGIKLAMGIPLDGPPSPDPSFFITSSLMHVD
jgi:hypothetical protein